MLPVITPRSLRLTRIQCVAVWFFAFSLVLVLANRFPRGSGFDETSWVPSAPSHLTAKVMAKEFFVLQSPAAVRVLLHRPVSLPVEIYAERPTVSIAPDNRLFTRPPPSA